MDQIVNAVNALFNSDEIIVLGHTHRYVRGLPKTGNFNAVDLGAIKVRRDDGEVHAGVSGGVGNWVVSNGTVTVGINTAGRPAPDGFTAITTSLDNPDLARVLTVIRAFMDDVPNAGACQFSTNHAPGAITPAQEATLPAWARGLLGIARSRGADNQTLSFIQGVVSKTSPGERLDQSLIIQHRDRVARYFASVELPPLWREQFVAAGIGWNGQNERYPIVRFEETYVRYL